MINLKVFAKKLRTIADSIDELFVDNSKENHKTAQKIISKRKKKHWTQKPENRMKMLQLIRKANRSKYEK